MELTYSILDPTGNITALAEDPVAIACQPEIAAAIMRRHPEVEQVGFLDAQAAELRMAGGEFCGNASMCAAALLVLRGARPGPAVRLRVSGAERPVDVRLRRAGEDRFLAEIAMPPALEIAERAFAFEGLAGRLPLVRMEGVSHLVVGRESAFFSLLADRPAAERAVRAFCAELKADCLGLLFLEGEGAERRLTPLVCVPVGGTLFWENSCASGSAAVGMLLAEKSGGAAELALDEPGGVLRVSCKAGGAPALLTGGVHLLSQVSENFSENC